MGKLIVFEGTDGSGKSTQFSLLTKRLQAIGKEFRTMVFPQYSEPSSALIRMYLGGEFGSRPTDVNAYAASTFFAVDRFASYRKVWKSYYDAGGLMLSDRYTTSNAVHQASKMAPEEREPFFRWLYEFEYEKTELTGSLMRKREAETKTNADIHEQHMDYLRLCRSTGLEAAECYGWNRIHCAKDGKMRSIEDIHNEIFALVMKCLEED